MREKKYKVLEDNRVLASNMSFEMAIVFIKGYENTYYNQPLNLTIREEELFLRVSNDEGYQE